MKRDIYICSKPLQYFNLRNIDYRNPEAKNILVFHTRFIDGDTFFERVREYDHSWDEIVRVENWRQLYTYLLFHPAQRIFVENDKSFVYGIYHCLRRFRKMYLFEEGFGSYRNDRIDESGGLKRMINRLTGVGKHVGFSRFLNGQFLYLPDLYREIFPEYPKSLLPFSRPFVDQLNRELPFFQQLSDGYESFITLRSKKIALYLTSHQVNENIIHELTGRKTDFDLIFVKPHPHLKNLEEIEQYSIEIIRSNIMVEFLIQLLINNNNRLSVFHENSTSVIWFQNKIENINAGPRLSSYDRVARYITGHKL